MLYLNRGGILTVLLLSLANVSRAAVSRPNFIHILADDWGWGDLFANNGNDAGLAPNHTPRLNKMASEGTLFVDFHVANPVCSPSRAGFMTGRGPSQFRIDTALNGDWPTNAQQGQANFLPATTPTVTSLLQAAGYRTGHYGKWHLGSCSGDDPASGLKNISAPGNKIKNVKCL
jgi:arylsulfatase A-like enzyme